eukprot:CAMPEP_0172329654 /NCGR_PEP_ID=MMETSP1058-20130122/60992_1 /TAXON_ID=83371 /ORGANISM="Detonula confervacea, Strain CCMP 353" /LENGTH=762 /DNA_ID=CAMNT_0013046839 /DNA_START=132 /DNA_END=2420 /DNA_ORIENTATION=-
MNSSNKLECSSISAASTKSGSEKDKISILDDGLCRKMQADQAKRAASSSGSFEERINAKASRSDIRTENKGASDKKLASSSANTSAADLFEGRLKAKMNSSNKLECSSISAASTKSGSEKDKISILDDGLGRKMQADQAKRAASSRSKLSSTNNSFGNIQTSDERIEGKLKKEYNASDPPPAINEGAKIMDIRSAPPEDTVKLFPEDIAPQLPPQMMIARIADDEGTMEQIEDDTPPLLSGVYETDGTKYSETLHDNTRVENSIRPQEREIPPPRSSTADPSHEDAPLTIPTIKLPPASTRRDSLAFTDEPSLLVDGPMFYAVEATLVNQDSSVASVYDAVFVPDDSSLPWWRRYKTKVGAAVILLAAAIIAVTVGAVVASRKNGGDKVTSPGLPPSSDTISDTMSPTMSPPLFTCVAFDLGSFYETDRESCNYAVGMDEKTALVTRKEIQFLSKSDGKYLAETQFPSRGVEEIAVSGNFVAASDIDYGCCGAISMFERDSSGQWNHTIRIAPDNMDRQSQFGRSISIDGSVMVVGAPNDRGTGTAFIYRRTNTTWEQEFKLVSEDPNIKNFGSSVLVKGNLVVVADVRYGDDNQGAVFMYQYDSLLNPWQQITNGTLSNNDCGGNFGRSIALTDDYGLLVGCPLANAATGAVYYYKQSRDGSQYMFEQKIEASDGVPLHKFGNNMVVAGNFMVVGTEKELNAKVYIFAKFDDVWKEVAKVDAPTNSKRFGSGIAMANETIFISSYVNTHFYKLSCLGEKQP